MLLEKIRFHTKEDPGSEKKIIIPQIVDFGATVTLIHDTGNHQVWHVPYSKYWVGIGLYGTSPTKLMLVEIKEDSLGVYGKIIQEIEPGRSWHRARKEIINLADAMAQGQV